MFGCSTQKYGYWPASVNVWLNVCPGTSSGLNFGEESNLPFGVPFSPDVAVCGCASSFVHVTGAPMLTWTGLGEKASVVRLEEQGTMETETEAPWFCCCNCGGCCWGGIGIGGDGVVLASVKVLLSMLVPPLPSGAEVKVKLLCMFSNLLKAKSKFPRTCKKKNDGAGGIWTTMLFGEEV